MPSRNRAQIPTLLDAIERHQFDALFGGARRDEEKARAKERIFSFRDEFGQWDPKNQRPELWHLYNGRIRKGEHIRVFPLSNWTEMDVWQYIAIEEIVVMGRRIEEYRRLVEEHEVDLLVMSAKDEDQLAMHGLSYPLAVELRQIPLLML